MCLPGKYPLSVVASHCLPWPSFHEVWLSEFSFMQIRAESNHSQCSTCLRHRHLIKSLGHHLLARRQQQMFYWQHLKDQYADRLEYYRLRSTSRMQDGQSILIIQDGMDQSKACIPRSKWMKSKEFSRFVRPRLHVSLTLVHGFFCLWSISDPDCMKDSNASTETLCHAMHLLERDFDVYLPGCALHIQADNTSREVKNNMLLRWAAAQVSSSNVRSITFRFLRQGHSHEDVDQAFGRLSRHLSSKLQRANVPQDFVDSVDGFAKAMYRPHEAGRYTVKLDRCRDWMLFLIHIICICPFSHSLISNHYQCKKDRDGFSSLASLFFSHAGIQKQKWWLRKNFHLGAVPFHITGVGGPGAPHVFCFQRRSDEELAGVHIENPHWGYSARPDDVILRTDHVASFCDLQII